MKKGSKIYYVICPNHGYQDGPFSTITEAQSIAENADLDEPVICEVVLQGGPKAGIVWRTP